MKKYSLFKLESSSDILNKQTIYLHHRYFGGNIWEIVKGAEVDTRCEITSDPIPKDEKRFTPTGFVPYMEKSISIAGMRILINQVKMREFKRNKRQQALQAKPTDDVAA